MLNVYMSRLHTTTLILLFLTCSATLFAQFAGGSGTDEDPYQVATPQHLDNVRNYLNSHFIQTADINLDVAPYNDSLGWMPIGVYISDTSMGNIPFTGVYDGSGFIIYNLCIQRQGVSGIGLFAYARDAILANIALEQCNIRGYDRTAGLCGYAYNVVFNNCQVTGFVQGGSSSGGLIGKCLYSDVVDSNARCIITSGGDCGGLVGWADTSNITHCYSRRSISGYYWVGGLVGYAPDSVINDCSSSANVTAVAKSCGGLVAGGWGLAINRSYATGNVSGHDDCGGLGGHLDEVTINNCFATGDVTASNHSAGGLVGFTCVSTTVTNSYSTGFITAPAMYGGLTGGALQVNQILNCYWDMETSGQSTSYGGIGRTTEQMTYPYDPETYVGWDFETTWQNDQHGSFNDGYPILSYMIPVANDDDIIPIVPDVSLSNYPNPFNDMTSIRFDIPKSSIVNLSIYNAKGQLVRTLTDGNFTKGEHTLTWDGKSDAGQRVANGIYFYQLKGTDFSITKKLLLTK